MRNIKENSVGIRNRKRSAKSKSQKEKNLKRSNIWRSNVGKCSIFFKENRTKMEIVYKAVRKRKKNRHHIILKFKNKK